MAKRTGESELKGIFQTKSETENYHRLRISTEDGALQGTLYLINSKEIPKKLIFEYQGEWKPKPKK